MINCFVNDFVVNNVQYDINVNTTTTTNNNNNNDDNLNTIHDIYNNNYYIENNYDNCNKKRKL